MIANQIAANLAFAPHPAAATAKRIRMFSDPRMKAMIRQADVQGMSVAAKAAITSL